MNSNVGAYKVKIPKSGSSFIFILNDYFKYLCLKLVQQHESTKKIQYQSKTYNSCANHTPNKCLLILLN